MFRYILPRVRPGMLQDEPSSTGVILPPDHPEPSSAVLSEQLENCFANYSEHFPFTLLFKTVACPPSYSDPTKPDLGFEDFISPLPNIPPIPTELPIPFNQLMDTDRLIETIGDIMSVTGYDLRHTDIAIIHLSYTYWNGQRQGHRTRLQDVAALATNWAREVRARRLPRISHNCMCEECILTGAVYTGTRGGERLQPHGFVVEVVFPHGSEQKRTEKGPMGEEERLECWAEKARRSFERREVEGREQHIRDRWHVWH